MLSQGEANHGGQRIQERQAVQTTGTVQKGRPRGTVSGGSKRLKRVLQTEKEELFTLDF